MGQGPSKREFRVPDPIIAFGPANNEDSLKQIRNAVSQLNTVLPKLAWALKQGGKVVDVFAKAVPFVAIVTSLVSTINNLLKQTENIHLHLGNTEQNVFSLILDGKLKALRMNLRLLQDENTSSGQKLAELVTAISSFNEILPLFTQSSSIFRVRYYVGGQLIVPVYALFRAICEVAEHTQGYNDVGLQELKQEYQEIFNWYKMKCIRERVLCCDLIGDLGRCYRIMQHGEEEEKEDLRTFTNYFANTTQMRRDDVLKCGRAAQRWYPAVGPYGTGRSEDKIVDAWDPRRENEMDFWTFTLYRGEVECLSPWATERQALRRYREEVINTMEEYFDVEE